MVRTPDRRAAGAPALIRAFASARQIDGSGTPARVVLVHPGSLPVTTYRELAESLSPTAQLYVVDLEQAPDYFQALGSGPLRTSIAGLADRVAAELRDKELLGGHWVLAGWSFGGVVGYALTSRLPAAARPQHLILLDSIAPTPAYTQDDGELEIDYDLVLPWFAMYLAAKRNTDIPVHQLALAGSGLEDGLEQILAAGIEYGALLPGTTLPGLRKVFDAYQHGLLRNNRLARDFTPVPLSTPTTLLRPENGLLATPDPLGWETLIADPAELTVLNCAGDHYSMVRHPKTVPLVADAASRPLTGALNPSLP